MAGEATTLDIGCDEATYGAKEEDTEEGGEGEMTVEVEEVFSVDPPLPPPPPPRELSSARAAS